MASAFDLPTRLAISTVACHSMIVGLSSPQYMSQSNDVPPATQVEIPSKQETPTPRFAFLGWCDNYNLVQIEPTNLSQANLMGLSQFRISHIYPFDLKGQIIFIAFYQLEIG